MDFSSPISGDDNSPVYFIRLSKQTPFRGDFAVNYHTRKIYVFAGRRVVERAGIQQLFQKYFDGGTPTLFKFDGKGVARYYPKSNGAAELEIYAKEPGTFFFEYFNRLHGKDVTHNWTVFSIPSYTLERGTPFAFKVDSRRVNIIEDKPPVIEDLENIKVDIRSEPGYLIIRGTGENIQNGTLLDIMIGKLSSRENWHRIRLLVEEPVPKESIQLWFENFFDTRKNFVTCVAAAYGREVEDLQVNTFTDLRNGTKFFEAQLSGVDTCSVQSEWSLIIHKK